jgi:hypothetical protein
VLIGQSPADLDTGVKCAWKVGTDRPTKPMKSATPAASTAHRPKPWPAKWSRMREASALHFGTVKGPGQEFHHPRIRIEG